MKEHLRGAIVDSIKKPFKFMNTTGEVVNSKEAQVVVKLVGGAKAVEKLEKVQTVVNKTNDVIDTVAKQAS